MTLSPKFLPALVFAVVMLSWMTFAALFLVHKKPPSGPEQKRERVSIIGIALQGVGYAIVWSVRRHFFTPIAAMSKPLEIALAGLTIVLAVGSVWFVSAAVSTLRNPPRRSFSSPRVWSKATNLLPKVRTE